MKFEKTLATLFKKTNCKLIYNKKTSNSWKKINTKEGFQCIFTQVILIDSIYRKDEN